MFGFDTKMLDALIDETGRREIMNKNVKEELCSSLTFVDDMHVFYAQAPINERETIRFEGYRMESQKLKVFWEWQFTGVYVYLTEEKKALSHVEIDPVVMYELLNALEDLVYLHIGRPQYSRANRVLVRKAVHNEQYNQYDYVDGYYEITDENSYVTAAYVEYDETFKSEIPSALLNEKIIKEQALIAEESKRIEQERLGF